MVRLRCSLNLQSALAKPNNVLHINLLFRLQLSPATHISFNPTSPHDYAVTTGTRVAVYDAKSNKERRNLSKFKDVVYSGSFREDGALLVAGTGKGLVQVVDVANKATLRAFKGHRGPVHVAQFAPDATKILSAGDDRSIRCWDMPSGGCVTTIEHAHEDYIRCAHTSPATPHIWATGSYDHTAKVWDTRALMGAKAEDEEEEDGEDGAEVEGEGEEADEAAAAADDDEDEQQDEEMGEAGSDADNNSEDGEDENDASGSDGDSDGDGSSNSESSDDDSSDDEEGDDQMDGGDDDDDAPTASRRASSAVSSSSSSNNNSNSSSSSTASPSLPGLLLAVDHGEPITQVLLLPGGSSLLTAGGNSVKQWDIVGGGRLVHSFSAHQKLITGMCLDGSGTRLLTSGLDGLVKVHELGTWAVLHSMHYDAPVISLAASPDNTRLVAGCGDGSLVVKQRKVKVADLVRETKQARVLRGGSYRYFLRGQGSAAASDDVRVSGGRKVKLAAYDVHLKAFSYRAALDAALLSGSDITVTSMFEELIARRGLSTALSGRDDDSLEPVLTFLLRHISDPRFTPLLLDVTNGE